MVIWLLVATLIGATIMAAWPSVTECLWFIMLTVTSFVVYQFTSSFVESRYGIDSEEEHP